MLASDETMCKCMYVYVATQEWLQPQTDFHRIVCMYYMDTRKEMKGVLCLTTCVYVYVRTYTQKRRLGNIRETQASILRKYMEPVEPGPYWHMKRFRSVSCRGRGLGNVHVRMYVCMYVRWWLIPLFHCTSCTVMRSAMSTLSGTDC